MAGFEMAAIFRGRHIGAKRFSRCIPAHPCLAAQSHEWQPATAKSFSGSSTRDMVPVMQASTYATTLHPTVAAAATNLLDFSRKVASGVHPAVVTDAIHARRRKQSSQMPHGAMCKKHRHTLSQKEEHETLYSQALPMFFNA